MMLVQPEVVAVVPDPLAVTQSPQILYGLMAVAIGQFAVLIGQWLTSRGARMRERDLAKANTDAAMSAAQITAAQVAAAAQIVDDRAKRDREWLIEDRKALASELAQRNMELAAKVQTTADALAAKQVVDLANVAQLGRQHAADLAIIVARDQHLLDGRVTKVTELADKAVSTLSGLITENTVLTKDVGVKADAAYQEANHVNLKIEDLNKQLLAAHAELAARTAAVGRGSSRRATDPHTDAQIDKIDATTTRIEAKQDGESV